MSKDIAKYSSSGISVSASIVMWLTVNVLRMEKRLSQQCHDNYGGHILYKCCR